MNVVHFLKIVDLKTVCNQELNHLTIRPVASVLNHIQYRTYFPEEQA